MHVQKVFYITKVFSRPLKCESLKANVRRCCVENVFSKKKKFSGCLQLYQKIDSSTDVLLWNISKFLRAHLLQNTSVRRLLKIHIGAFHLGVLISHFSGAYFETSQASKIKLFAKLLTIFAKSSILRCLTAFWILLFLCFMFWFKHCVKSVQMRSYFWSVFSYIRTEYGDLL